MKKSVLGNVLKLGHPSQDLRKRNVESALEGSAAAQSRTRFENGRFSWLLILLWDLFLGMKQWLAGCLDMFFSTLRKNEKIPY